MMALIFLFSTFKNNNISFKLIKYDPSGKSAEERTDKGIFSD